VNEIIKKYTARFKRSYNKAVKNGATQFNFDRQVVLVSFGKYYLQYLEGLVKKREEEDELRMSKLSSR